MFDIVTVTGKSMFIVEVALTLVVIVYNWLWLSGMTEEISDKTGDHLLNWLCNSDNIPVCAQTTVLVCP